MRLAPLLAAALLVASCGQKAEAPADAPKKAPDPVVAPAASAGQSVSFRCDGKGELRITAVYGTNAQGQADVALFIRGQDFALTETPSTAGARYATADGLEPGMGLIWVVNGSEARLQQAPSDKVADEAAGQTIRTCTVQQ